jgi:hypothetical protein
MAVADGRELTIASAPRLSRERRRGGADGQARDGTLGLAFAVFVLRFAAFAHLGEFRFVALLLLRLLLAEIPLLLLLLLLRVLAVLFVCLFHVRLRL